jgi:hypothetical protein
MRVHGEHGHVHGTGSLLNYVRVSPAVPNKALHPHKTIILGDMELFSYSSSSSINFPIFGGHQKNSSSPL